jgi:uncharacterized protein (DUF305 family)
MDPARHYIEWMIPHHEDAVIMTSFAPTQAEHPELRALAAHISQTQTNEIGRMRRWYQAWYGTDVPAMDGGMLHMMGSHDPTSVDGARPFDKTFVEGMIPHHEIAVVGSTMALQRIERPELRELLQSIITSQSAEIAQMRSWYQAWYGVPVPETDGMESHQMMGAAGQDHARMMGEMGGHTMMGGTRSLAGHGTDGHQIGGSPTTTDRQQTIHERGASVMPFDLNQTTHRFQVLPDGGLQTVTAKDATNQTQIPLIQQHLAEEAARFQRGDFSDPASLHGQDMPGLAELTALAARIEVVYTALPDGAQIRYTTQDPAVLTAIHAWFAAQLSDHGADAIAD